MKFACSIRGRFLACALAALSLGGACADEPAVSSDPSAGLLARLDYEGGASVEFVQSGDRVSIVGTASADGFQPLSGVSSSVAPSELFEELAGAPAPTALGTRTASAAGSSAIAAAFTCGSTADVCAVGRTHAQTFRSGARIDGVTGRLVVTSGTLRMRIIYSRVGDDRVMLDLITGPIDRAISEFVPGVDRNIRVEITEVSGAYDIWLDWRD